MPAPDLEELTSRYFARWAVSFETMTAAFTEVLAPDCVWEQRPVVTHSRRGALGFLRLARRFRGTELVAWRDHMGVPAMVGRIVLGTVRRRPLRPTGSDD